MDETHQLWVQWPTKSDEDACIAYIFIFILKYNLYIQRYLFISKFNCTKNKLGWYRLRKRWLKIG